MDFSIVFPILSPRRLHCYGGCSAWRLDGRHPAVSTLSALRAHSEGEGSGWYYNILCLLTWQATFFIHTCECSKSKHSKSLWENSKCIYDFTLEVSECPSWLFLMVMEITKTRFKGRKSIDSTSQWENITHAPGRSNTQAVVKCFLFLAQYCFQDGRVTMLLQCSFLLFTSIIFF